MAAPPPAPLPVLPWPGGWHRPVLNGPVSRVTALAVALIVIAVAIVVRAGIVEEQGMFQAEPALLVLGICIVLLLGHAARHVLLRPSRSVGPPVLVQVAGLESWGVRFRLRRMPTAVAVASIVLGLAVAGLAGYVALEEIAPIWWEDQILTLVAGALAAAHLVASGIADLLAGARRDAIELTPHHLVLRLGRRPVILEWSDLHDVRALLVHTLSEYGALRRNAIAVDSWHFETATMTTGRLADDPALVYHGLRFYWRHPEARAELASWVAVHRLDGRQVVISEPPG